MRLRYLHCTIWCEVKSTMTTLIEEIRTSESPWTLVYSILKSPDDSTALQRALESRIPDIVEAIRTAEDPIEIIRFISALVSLRSNPLIAGAAEERVGDIATMIVSTATDYRCNVFTIIDRITYLSVLCNSSEIHEAIDEAADIYIAAGMQTHTEALPFLLDRLAMYNCLAKHDRIQDTTAKIIAVIPWATSYITKSVCLLSSPKVLETILHHPESALIVLDARPDFEHASRLAECVAKAISKGYMSHMTPEKARTRHKQFWKFESIQKALLERQE